MKATTFIKSSAAGAALATAFATAATAATFSISGGTATTLPASYNPSCGGCTTPAVGDAITAFQAGTNGGLIGGGLNISATSKLTYTYIGKEAGAQNAVFGMGGVSLTNTGSVGATAMGWQIGPGSVNFNFQTAEGAGWEDLNGNGVMGDLLSIYNNGTSDYSGMSIAFSNVFNNGKSVYVFFGDGRGDVDYDDMVIRIDAVPLPATALMLFGAVGGLGAFGLRKKKA